MTSPAIAVDSEIGRLISISRSPRRRAHALTTLAALTAAALVAVSTASMPLAPHRALAGGGAAKLQMPAWGPISRALGRDNPAYRATARAGGGFVARLTWRRIADAWDRASTVARDRGYLA